MLTFKRQLEITVSYGEFANNKNGFEKVRIPVIVSSDSGANVSTIPVIVSTVPVHREQRAGGT